MSDREGVGNYDYDGSCKPGAGSWASQETFSVSIFKWVKRASGGRLKRAKSVYRIYGLVSDPEKVYQRVGDVCDFLDHGGVLEKKS